MAPGFIHNALDIKMLILYILCRTEGPVDFAALTDLALRDQGADYFTFAQAAQELVKSGHVSLENGVYSITEKGRANSAITESSLPGVVRTRYNDVLDEFNANARRQAQVTAQVVTQEDQVRVELGLSDGVRSLFHLSLLAPSEEQGQQVARRFQQRPEELFTAILALLTTDLKEEDS